MLSTSQAIKMVEERILDTIPYQLINEYDNFLVKILHELNLESSAASSEFKESLIEIFRLVATAYTGDSSSHHFSCIYLAVNHKMYLRDCWTVSTNCSNKLQNFIFFSPHK